MKYLAYYESIADYGIRCLDEDHDEYDDPKAKDTPEAAHVSLVLEIEASINRLSDVVKKIQSTNVKDLLKHW